jgi:predicted nucleic acid-binding Zn ribbon protein
MATIRSKVLPPNNPVVERALLGGPRPFLFRRSEPMRRDARQTVLAEWRRLDLGPLEKAWADQSRPVSDVLQRVVTELNLDRRLADAEVFKAWNHLVDPQIAAHAQPAGLRNGTLFVNVDHSAWLNEIVRYRRREILTRLQHAFGAEMVAKISFRLG